MSNERLERIKERVNYHGHLDDDIAWLIEQVEHLKGLEESLRLNIKIKQEGIDFLKQENERYREALERIKNYYPGVPNAEFIPIEMLFEVHLIAREVLESDNE